MSYRDSHNHRTGERRSCFATLLNLLSFWTLQSFITRLRTIWADRLVSRAEWRNLLNSLVADWGDSNLLVSPIDNLS